MLKIIEGKSLLIRPFDELNDPFESLPAIDESGARNIISGQLNHRSLQRKLVLDPAIVDEELTVTQFRLKLQNTEYRNGIVGKLVQQSKVTPLEFARHFRTFMSGRLGIISFSVDPANILMWSHYADQHRGYVFGFETLPWNEENVHPVDYDLERVSFTAGVGSNEEFIKLTRTKFTDWKYEKEYRVICHGTGWRQIAGRNGALQEFKKEQLKWICAGIKTADEDIETVKKALAASGFVGVPVYRSEIHPSEFHVTLPNETKN